MNKQPRRKPARMGHGKKAPKVGDNSFLKGYGAQLYKGRNEVHQPVTARTIDPPVMPGWTVWVTHSDDTRRLWIKVRDGVWRCQDIIWPVYDDEGNIIKYTENADG